MSEGALKRNLAGLAFWGAGAYGIWWANYRMIVYHMAAPFLVGSFFGCIFFPLGVICFVIAIINWPEPNKNRPGPSETWDLPGKRYFKDFD